MIFSLDSGLCALSRNPGQLIFFRALRAVGAAMIMAKTVIPAQAGIQMIRIS